MTDLVDLSRDVHGVKYYLFGLARVFILKNKGGHSLGLHTSELLILIRIG